jgi:hypothetical protein
MAGPLLGSVGCFAPQPNKNNTKKTDIAILMTNSLIAPHFISFKQFYNFKVFSNITKWLGWNLAGPTDSIQPWEP